MNPSMSVISSQPPPQSFFWAFHIDFYIGLIVGLVGLWLSFLAFREAKAAAKAALAAGRVVRIQTTTIELTEILQRLDGLAINIEYAEARDLLTEVSRRLLRYLAPFQSDADLTQPMTELNQALAAARKALESVRPNVATTGQQSPSMGAVYYAIEGQLSLLNNSVATILGLLETKSFGSGDENASE